MATTAFFESLTSIVTDLSRNLPADRRYQNLLDAILRIFPCDAAALLRLDGKHLCPLAIMGLSEDTMGRRFLVDEHPRLARLLHSREPVRFSANSELPDPYDGLVTSLSQQLRVHDCMGVSLYIDEQPWGALTLDALEPGTFDSIDPVELRTFIGLTEATVKAAERINALAIRAEREHLAAGTLLGEGRGTEIVGNSKVMEQLKDEIAIVARSHLTVLILGETGVGKELVARQVHQQSARAERPLVYVNCAALPENLAESELFGHVRGAFSGAVADRAGKFEISDGGTLFLDEIGELPLSIQATLLRALQSGEIQRVGSDRQIQVDVRIVAATNRDLQQEVAQGRFRADLYHRLSVYPLLVPALRDHPDDIPLLAGYLLEANQRRLGIQALRLDKGAIPLLKGYPWPGNVRELEHLLSRAALKATTEQGRGGRVVTLQTRHLGIDADEELAGRAPAPPREQEGAGGLAQTRPLDPGTGLKEAVDAYQAALVRATLEHHQGNQAAAARDLGLDRSNFHRLIRRMGIEAKHPPR